MPYLDGKMDGHGCSSSFNNENIVRLIQLYELYRALWDSTVLNYRNNDLPEDAWKAISNEVKIPIELFKKKSAARSGSLRSVQELYAYPMYAWTAYSDYA